MSTTSRLAPPEPTFAGLFTRKLVTVLREGVADAPMARRRKEAGT
jgi:hypothetical protein